MVAKAKKVKAPPAGTGRRGLLKPSEAAKLLREKLAKDKPLGQRYKPETYMVVTRWTDKTRVKYGPNPKTLGSKSHPRYEKYSKAKTVGEALRLGAYPPDLLWDFERNFYKVTGWPMRDEPIDLHRAKAEGMKLTRTDELLGKWVINELCRELGTDQATLVREAGPGQNGIIHALRKMADKEAAHCLQQAKAAGRKLSTEDLLRTLRRWCYGQNPYRVNVMQEGLKWVNSDTVGLNCGRDGDVHATRPTLLYPNVMRLLARWIRERQPKELAVQFPFTSVNMNFGYGARRHRDGNNIGLSMLAAFGDFKGGELNYWPEDDRKLGVEALPAKGRASVDLSKNLMLFDGHRCHEVNGFKGERYSLVWFTCARYWKAGDALKKLADMGFEIPTEARLKAVEKALGPPAGYGSTAKASKLPGYMTWPIDGAGGATGEASGEAGGKRGAAAGKQAAAPAKRRRVAAAGA